MITKPSLSELLEGVAKTAEQVLLPPLVGTSVVERITSILMLLIGSSEMAPSRRVISSRTTSTSS